MRLPYSINKRFESVIWLTMAASAAASVWFYRNFPDRVPTHWNAAGEVDGWSSPEFAAFFFPAIIIALYLLLVFLPAADPQKKRYKEFSRPYQVIRFAIVAYMTMLYFVTSLIGIGHNISVPKVMALSIGLLFVILGNFMPKFKKNWFVGIRTPWTLSDEDVWNRTHRVAGKLWSMGGILIMLTAFLPAHWSFTALMIIIFAVVIATVCYSWWLWRARQ
jgi:uncharacterized membrane protein